VSSGWRECECLSGAWGSRETWLRSEALRAASCSSVCSRHALSCVACTRVCPVAPTRVSGKRKLVAFGAALLPSLLTRKRELVVLNRSSLELLDGVSGSCIHRVSVSG
jgi:hypothetical protein